MSDFRKSRLEEAYCNNAEFKRLVDSLHNMIVAHGFTPSELREAVFMAHYKYEMEKPFIDEERIKLFLDRYGIR